MDTSYIYSVSRANALSQTLLNKTDIERLLVAMPGEDVHTALKETYLAPYVAQVPNEDVAIAIEQTLIEAKKLIHRVAPEGDMFRVLWVQYDIHNLRVMAKAKAQKLELADYQSLLSERGIYDPEYLHEVVESNSLDFLQSGWQRQFDLAVEFAEAGKIDKIDSLLDELFFTTCQRITAEVGDSFMKGYLKTLIDLHNLKSKLRLLRNPSIGFKPEFIAGGYLEEVHMETVEDILSQFTQFGGVDFWKEAIDYYRSSGNTTSLDARSSEYMLMYAKEASYDMFSSASLVLYYLKCRQAAANIRIIVVGKDSGMRDSAIRPNLRMAYVSE